MTKHTPEPWCITPGDLIFLSKVGGRGYIAKMMPLDAPLDRKKGLTTGTSDEMCANARRIVACVNACRGLPIDELERKGLVAAVGTQLLDLDESLTQARAHASAYKDRYAKEASRAHDLERQCDELLAVLEGVLAIVGDSGGVAGYHLNGDIADWGEFDEINAVYAAIAKAKGEPQPQPNALLDDVYVAGGAA